MVLLKSFTLEEGERKDREYSQCDHLLNHFELHQTKRPAVGAEANAVDRHLETVFKKGDAPADEDDGKQSQVLKRRDLFKLQVTVPGKRINKKAVI